MLPRNSTFSGKNIADFYFYSYFCFLNHYNYDDKTHVDDGLAEFGRIFADGSSKNLFGQISF